MRLGARWGWIILILIPALAYGAYRLGRQLWADGQYRAARDAVERRDFRQASLHLNKYFEVSPNDLTARLLAAQTSRREGDFKTARHHLEIVSELNGPKEALALEQRLLGIQQGNLKDTKAALGFCVANPESLDTPPMLEAILEGSLRLLTPSFAIRRKVPPEDMPDLEKAVALWLQLRPDWADQIQGLVWRGRLHNYRDEYDKGIADLREALKRDPEHFEARQHLAAAVAQGSPQEAAEHLQYLLKRHPDNPHVRFALATVRRGQGQLDEAARILDQMLVEYPEDVTSLIERAQVALDAQKPAEAEVWLRQALKLKGNLAEVHLALYRCLHAAGNEREARYHYNRFEQIEAERARPSSQPK